MNISQPNLFVIILITVAFVIIIITTLIMLSMIRRLNASFAKLGYVTREDAKKYFGDAADKVVDMNSNFSQQYQEMIDSGVRKVLSESGEVMAGSLAQAQQEAGAVILKAQEDARQIMSATKADAEVYYNKALNEAVDAVEWTMEQYVKSHMDVKEHEEVIKRLLETYINERRT